MDDPAAAALAVGPLVAVGFLHDNTLWQYKSDGSVSPGAIHGWSTRPGWDMTTGLGTPRVAQFVADLAAF